MNLSPRQMANVLAVAVFGAAASIYHEAPGVTEQMGLVGGFLLGIAQLLPQEPIQRAPKPRVIQASAVIQVGTATITATGAFGGAAYGGAVYGG